MMKRMMSWRKSSKKLDANADEDSIASDTQAKDETAKNKSRFRMPSFKKSSSKKAAKSLDDGISVDNIDITTENSRAYPPQYGPDGGNEDDNEEVSVADLSSTDEIMNDILVPTKTMMSLDYDDSDDEDANVYVSSSNNIEDSSSSSSQGEDESIPSEMGDIDDSDSDEDSPISSGSLSYRRLSSVIEADEEEEDKDLRELRHSDSGSDDNNDRRSDDNEDCRSDEDDVVNVTSQSKLTVDTDAPFVDRIRARDDLSSESEDDHSVNLSHESHEDRNHSDIDSEKGSGFGSEYSGGGGIGSDDGYEHRGSDRSESSGDDYDNISDGNDSGDCVNVDDGDVRIQDEVYDSGDDSYNYSNVDNDTNSDISNDHVTRGQGSDRDASGGEDDSYSHSEGDSERDNFSIDEHRHGDKGYDSSGDRAGDSRSEEDSYRNSEGDSHSEGYSASDIESSDDSYKDSRSRRSDENSVNMQGEHMDDMAYEDESDSEVDESYDVSDKDSYENSDDDDRYQSSNSSGSTSSFRSNDDGTQSRSSAESLSPSVSSGTDLSGSSSGSDESYSESISDGSSESSSMHEDDVTISGDDVDCINYDEIVGVSEKIVTDGVDIQQSIDAGNESNSDEHIVKLNDKPTTEEVMTVLPDRREPARIASTAASFLASLNSDVDAALICYSALNFERKRVKKPTVKETPTAPPTRDVVEVNQEEHSTIQSNLNSESESDPQIQNSNCHESNTDMSVKARASRWEKLSSQDSLQTEHCRSSDTAVDFTLQIDEIVTKGYLDKGSAVVEEGKCSRDHDDYASENGQSMDNNSEGDEINIENIQEDVRQVITECVSHTITRNSPDSANTSGVVEDNDTESSNASDTVPKENRNDNNEDSQDIDEINREIEKYFQLGTDSAERKICVHVNRDHNASERREKMKMDVLSVGFVKSVEAERLDEEKSDDFLSLYFNLGRLYAGASSEVNMY